MKRFEKRVARRGPLHSYPRNEWVADECADEQFRVLGELFFCGSAGEGVFALVVKWVRRAQVGKAQITFKL